MSIVRDPSTNTGMNVDSEGRGQVESKMVVAAAEANKNHNAAYVMELPAVILGSNWIWAVIKNTDDDDLHIVRCVLWTTTSKSNDWVAAYTRGAFTYASNGTAATPSCCNSGGALSATGSFYYNDAVGDMTTITAGQSCGSILVTTTPQEFKIESGWVVPKNQTWYLKSELANDNTYRGWIEFFYHNGS
jgi:hypothetical protein